MIAGWGCHAVILQLFSLEGVDTSGSKIRTMKSHYWMSTINTMLTIQVIGAQKHKSWAEELLPSTPWESRLGSPFAIPAWFLTATETKFRSSYIKKILIALTLLISIRGLEMHKWFSLLTSFILLLQYCALVKSGRLWKKCWSIIKLHKTWKAEWLQT